MEPIFDFPVLFNAYLAGQWRVIIRWDFIDGLKSEIACMRFYGDIVEL